MITAIMGFYVDDEIKILEEGVVDSRRSSPH